MSMDFVLALHSHLPWVLNHGRWPHGSDWLTEAALETYLPLLERLRALQAEDVDAPITIGFTPVLANQLVSPTFQAEMEVYLEQRRIATADAQEGPHAPAPHLRPVVEFWRHRFEQMQTLWRAIDGDIVGAFRALERSGRIEIMGSAATHGFLPLLARDESIRLQLGAGMREHERLFGRAPRGCWLPECAYRPRGPWAPWPGGPRSALRRGIDEHIADAGFRYFFVDAHLVTGDEPLDISSDGWIEAAPEQSEPVAGESATRSPYRAYGVLSAGRARVSIFVRDPRASRQVWSRHGGYPGDSAYLEFHKQRWPGGLRLWRVSAPGTDLGQKEPYDPAGAQHRAAEHAEHFAWLLGDIAGELGRRQHPVLAVPFDTELFGHWWFEGPEFLADTYRAMQGKSRVTPSTAEKHLERYPPRAGIRLPEGSWGAHGDFSMWLSNQVAWTWQRLWPLEEAFWNAAPAALADPSWHPVLEQAAREMLLAQASDWQFIISTGMVADYGERRFRGHCDAADQLVAALAARQSGQRDAALHQAEEARHRDDCFPSLLPVIRAALDGTRALS
jgi:1,4-alpha-glucan branching enzyme